eukprot:GHVH01005349.1.p1 GENE.GHVH01005349.1~~GHVH01005349.1.p1  ORF type:complete len:233 (-),score=44.03 GHVH01005349.1:616-1314(-)
MVEVGDLVPNTNVSLRDSDVQLREFFQTRKGVFIGVNGAFEPASTRMLNDVKPLLPILKERVSLIGVIAVNDPYVLKAWGRRLKLVEHLTFISDVNGTYSQKLGVDCDLSPVGFGKHPRTQFFCLVVEEGSIISYFDRGDETNGMIERLGAYLKQLKLESKPSASRHPSSFTPLSTHPKWRAVVPSEFSRLKCVPPPPPPPLQLLRASAPCAASRRWDTLLAQDRLRCFPCR